MSSEKYEYEIGGHTVNPRMAAKVGVVIVAAVALPLVFGPFTASNVLVLAILAMGYNILLGYGGELSFGHAAFYGGGAYLTAIYGQTIPNLYVSVVLAVVTVGVISVVYGAISLRRRGLYFAMITLALAMMFYTAVNQATDITGGANGLILPFGPADAAIGPLRPLESQMDFYIIGVVLTAACVLIIYRIINSPFGRALVAIRESEDRARHLGYPINRMLLMSFVMSAMFAGLAGALHAMLFTFIGPGLLFWTLSGEIVLVTILGGIGTLGGPLVGAVVFGILSEQLSSITENWPIIFGAIFVLIVMLAPQGLYGIYLQYVDSEAENPTTDIREVLRRLIEG
jgi:ABC-type branched-subunit amino acid transport system permease subunit